MSLLSGASSSAALWASLSCHLSNVTLRRCVEYSRVWRIRPFLILILCVNRLLGHNRTPIIRNWDPGIFWRAGRKDGWAPEDAGRVAGERADVLGAQLVLLLQCHRVPQGDIVGQERAGLIPGQSVPQHQRVARRLGERVLQGDSQGIRHDITGISREPQSVRNPKRRAHRPLGRWDRVGAQRVFKNVPVGGQNETVRFCRGSLPAGRWRPTGQENLYSTHQVTTTPLQDQLQHSWLLVRENLLQDFKWGSVCFQTERQRNCPRRTFYQEVVLLWVVLGAVWAVLCAPTIFLDCKTDLIHWNNFGAFGVEAAFGFSHVWGTPLVCVFVTVGLSIVCSTCITQPLLIHVCKEKSEKLTENWGQKLLQRFEDAVFLKWTHQDSRRGERAFFPKIFAEILQKLRYLCNIPWE